MFRDLTVGGALALAFVATPVAAEPFETFSRFCLDNDARRDAVAADLTKAGWFAPEIGNAFPPETGIRDGAIYFDQRAAEAGPPEAMEMIMTGWGDGSTVMDMPGLTAELCGVMTPTGDAPAIRAKLAARFGFEPTDMDGEEVWIYSRDGDGFRTREGILALDEEQAEAAVRERDIYVTGVVVEDDMLIVMMGAIRPGD